MFSKRVALLLAALFCLFAVTPSALFAQSASTGTVAGTVTDPSGGAIVGATVTLTDTATNTPRTTTTNEAGRYFFANVLPGSCNVSVSKTGFRVSKLIDQLVTVGASLTLNVSLELGSVAETVEVTVTNGAELQTLNATVGNTVSGDLLQKLPSIGRDSSTFVTLQPGVSPDGSVAGAVVDQSTFMLDGGQNTNDMDGSMQVYTPSFAGDPTGGIVSNSIGGAPTGVMPTPLDSVEEFKVNTANQTADFNSSAGAQVQVVTKRGTNAWHGTAYEYYFDNNFNANTWDNNASATPLPSYHYNRMGAAGGGPIIPKSILGGKTYFFANFEGFWWPGSTTIERLVPTASLRAGILTFPDASGNPVQYNMKTGTNCGPSGTAACDPRGLGISPSLTTLWSFMPLPNEVGTSGGGCGGFSGSPLCDGLNEQGFKANASNNYTSYFGVARLDHDFGSKWHFNSSYRYYKLTRASTSEVDIGGFFPGDTKGTPAILGSRPQQPWYFVASLTTNITSNTTNDFHFSYLRNYWAWGDPGCPPQISGLGGALEPFGENGTHVLSPYNVDTQDVRTRFWDGQDKYLRDDITMLKGNHLFTFGGAYQRNWDWHQRSDNGGGINFQPTYQLGLYNSGSGSPGNVDFTSTNPAGVDPNVWGALSSAVLGVVTQSQIAYTRQGSALTLNPPLTHAEDKSTIPYYNVYWSDSWHMKPSFTLTYGLGWTLEMPPTEALGRQVELVDQSGQQLDLMSYLNSRKAAALQGQVYNPEVGFALVGNTGGGQKYPYKPFYGSFSPRVAAAWNPNYDSGLLGKVLGHGMTVIRGGYSRVYGRLNGVDLVLVPLLGTGLIQAVQCTQTFRTGVCGPNNPTVANAFRVGPTAGGWDGLVAPIPAAAPTLPQPDFPGINAVAAGAGEALDTNFRPNVVDSFDFTIQRQLTNKIILELGYIGRRITHEYQPININAVPYMMTVGGQTFAQAYAAVEKAMGCATSYAACRAAKAATTVVAPQPFFEAALAGTGYCAPGTCTATVVANEFAQFQKQKVWSLWSDLDKGGIGGGPGGGTTPGFNFHSSMLNSPINTSAFGANGQLSSGVGVNASIGYGNYNGGFVSLKMMNWHHITLQQNFTYSKALGTGAVVQAASEYTANDPFDLHNMYGDQNFDRKFVYNIYALIDDPYYTGQHGAIGRLLGGWSIAPVFAAGSGAPVYCNTRTDAQSFGSGDGSSFFDNEQCIFTGAHPSGSSSLHSDGNPAEFQIFANPAALLATVRPAILGLDTGTGGNGGLIRGLSYWNMDVRVTKNIKVWERTSFDFQYVVTNVFNHPVFSDPGLSPSGNNVANFGVVSSQGNNPRQMQFGVRFSF
jgi:hypothetical protein